MEAAREMAEEEEQKIKEDGDEGKGAEAKEELKKARKA